LSVMGPRLINLGVHDSNLIPKHLKTELKILMDLIPYSVKDFFTIG